MARPSPQAALDEAPAVLGIDAKDALLAVRHHLDPANGLLNYDVTQLPAIFRPEVDTDVARRNARIAAIDPLLVPVGLSEQEFASLMDFLHSLTDPKSLNLLRDIPDSVPSGLPVKD